jgi:serine/threonine protein kinase
MVDMWSIGVISHLLVCGALPFSHDFSENEIAKKIIHNDVKYNKDMNDDAREFISSSSY